MEELQEALHRYKAGKVIHFETESNYLVLIENLPNIVPFERPDGYFKSKDLVYIIEHFEFDSSRSTKKGSSFRQELGRTEREFDNHPLGNKIYSSKLSTVSSAENYIENAIQNMEKHYNKKEEYIEQLKLKDIINKSSTVYFGFFIEDKNFLGSYYREDNLKPLYLPYCLQFLDQFENSLELDFCICASSHAKNFDCNILSLFSHNTFPFQEKDRAM